MQTEQPVAGKVVIGPSLVITASTSAFTASALSQDRSQASTQPAIEFVEAP
jgi:hypothetical protein